MFGEGAEALHQHSAEPPARGGKSAPLAARDAYRLWAPSYADETAISFLETRLVAGATPPLHGLRLLDAGCGTGRRLEGCGARSAVGVDLSPDMLDAGIGRGQISADLRTFVADIAELPLPDAAFDMIWCRLVIGHLADCRPAYAEFGRVAAPGAQLIVTDFHDEAHAAGHRRTFRAGGIVHEAEHHAHKREEQIEAAARAGLSLVDEAEARIGPEVLRFYARAGRSGLYGAHAGLAVVRLLAFRRQG